MILLLNKGTVISLIKHLMSRSLFWCLKSHIYVTKTLKTNNSSIRKNIVPQKENCYSVSQLLCNVKTDEQIYRQAYNVSQLLCNFQTDEQIYRQAYKDVS